MKRSLFAVPMVVLCVLLFANPLLASKKPKVDPRLASVTTIFVEGNNQGAEKAREVIQDGKTCFTLVGKPADADATLKIDADSQSSGSRGFGEFGSRQWIVSGQLTLKNGDLVWSHSERFGDAPFMSGGKTAGELVIRRLAAEAGCKERQKQH